MPSLENSKHETFALLLALGRTVETAYAEAGYAPDAPNALRLAKRRDVQHRLREIREGIIPAVVAEDMPRDETSMLDYLRDVALGRRPGSQTQVAAARAALSASNEAQQGSGSHWRPIRGKTFNQATYDALSDEEIYLYREMKHSILAGHVVDNREIDWRSWPVAEPADEPLEARNPSSGETVRRELEKRLSAYGDKAA